MQYLKHTFRTLRYKNFRLFFLGQSVSLIGTWMQNIAMSWLVYKLTDSAFMLGVISFSTQIPIFIFSPIAGVVADRFNKRNILLITQVLFMVQALILSVLTISGAITVNQIVILGFLFGIINAIDIPARHSMVVEMVEGKENISNAVALNSMMFNSARLIGPMIAGILIGIVGEGMCFFINGVCFLAVILALLGIKISLKPAVKHENAFAQLKDGVRYAFSYLPIRSIIYLSSVVSLMGASYIVLMPIFAKDILKGGPETLGLLMTAAGVGAILATLYLAGRKNASGLGAMIPASTAMFSIGLFLFAFSKTVWLSLCLTVFSGFCFVVTMASCNIILQTVVDDAKRGRVMSFYTMSFIGIFSIGSLLSGAIASRLGAESAVVIGSVFCIVIAVVFAKKIPKLKKIAGAIYEKTGIIETLTDFVDIPFLRK